MSNSNNSSGSQNPPFPMFDGGNYDFWCVKMKTLFVSYELWDYVRDGFEEVEDVQL